MLRRYFDSETCFRIKYCGHNSQSGSGGGLDTVQHSGLYLGRKIQKKIEVHGSELRQKCLLPSMAYAPVRVDWKSVATPEV